MAKQTRSMLFLSRQSPFSSALASGGFDILLTAAAFDQAITLAFSDDGVYHLLANQNSEAIGLKNVSKILTALEMYEVKTILVEQTALESRGLNQSDLLIPVEIVTTNKLTELITNVDTVFTF